MLIKAAAQATPSYAMSVFKIPLRLCEVFKKQLLDSGREKIEKKRVFIG